MKLEPNPLYQSPSERRGGGPERSGGQWLWTALLVGVLIYECVSSHFIQAAVIAALAVLARLVVYVRR
jgi:hypothetical protein